MTKSTKVIGHTGSKFSQDDDSVTPTNSPRISARMSTSCGLNKKSSSETNLYAMSNKVTENSRLAHRRILIAKRNKSFKTNGSSPDPPRPHSSVHQMLQHSEKTRTSPSQSLTSYAGYVTPKCFSPLNQREAMPFASKRLTYADGERGDGAGNEIDKPDIPDGACRSDRDPTVRINSVASLSTSNSSTSSVTGAKKMHNKSTNVEANNSNKYEKDTSIIYLENADTETSKESPTEDVSFTHSRAIDHTSHVNDESVESTSVDQNVEGTSLDLGSEQAAMISTPTETSWLPSTLQPVIRERVKQFLEKDSTCDVQELQEKVTSSPISDKILKKVEIYENLGANNRDFTKIKDKFVTDQIEVIVKRCIEDACSEIRIEFEALEQKQGIR